jgi:tRNA (cytosine40_48-C5)-methyltransferase
LKTNNSEIEKILKEKNIKFKKVSFLSNAYILEDTKESDLWDLDIFKNGHIYLQSISSQIPVEILSIKEDDKILDITAAPG